MAWLVAASWLLSHTPRAKHAHHSRMLVSCSDISVNRKAYQGNTGLVELPIESKFSTIGLSRSPADASRLVLRHNSFIHICGSLATPAASLIMAIPAHIAPSASQPFSPSEVSIGESRVETINLSVPSQRLCQQAIVIFYLVLARDT